MVAVGEISYALYATHLVTKAILNHFQVSAWLIFLASIAVGAIVHICFERPVMRLLAKPRQASIPVKPLGGV
jgi:peptidoglycan/LPS O-acetylase OafA/YrhL